MHCMIPPSFAVCHSVYANTALLEELGLEYPETFEELLTQVPAIRAAGYYPVSMGNKDQPRLSTHIARNY